MPISSARRVEAWFRRTEVTLGSTQHFQEEGCESGVRAQTCGAAGFLTLLYAFMCGLATKRKELLAGIICLCVLIHSAPVPISLTSAVALHS